MTKIDKKFFDNTPIQVARNILGKKIIINAKEAIITEVEAYGGSDDMASHAYKQTPRSTLMFDEPGKIYVYLIYGMHYCLNFVTSPKGIAGAVLIRSIYINGTEVSGPGRTTSSLGIDLSYNGLDIFESDSCALIDCGYSNKIYVSSRIGISKDTDKPWRFYYNGFSIRT